ncbi:MAG: NAD-dependent epimerase/dehydratase family protein [Bacteroidia bacterium]|nr:NAD-dependent epimerase/dehydratase family protein [Bacteroidia bacterium]MCX7652964.1 NAD-dependent epimerase/dehydratase family protein [Bacteroidia bacterium]MDW8417473.1 NAD-dependent epimerase/dehydratase family protein [Bacteroidia bacterium]
MRILVTGGAGFIGSHLVEALLDSHSVSVIDNLSTGRRENLPDQVPLFQIDLRDRESLQAHFREYAYDVVMHLAAQVDVRTSVEAPLRDAEINIIGTLNLLEAVQSQRPWFFFASTGGAIYGEKSHLPIPETEVPQPESPYGIAKLAGEMYIKHFARVHDFPYTILRLANVYGPRQNPHGEAGVVAIFTHRLLKGETAFIYGDGEQTRDFIHVKDVVSAFLAILNAGECAYSQILNVGTGKQTTVNALYQTIAESIGTLAKPTYLPPKPGELRRNALSSDMLSTLTGWKPFYNLSTGVKDTVSAFRQDYS